MSRYSRALGLAVLAASFLLSTAACGGDEPVVAPATERGPSAEPDAAQILADMGIPPTPAPAEWKAYIAALNKIDPAIVGEKDEERIIDRGRDMCSVVKEWPDDEAKLVDLTNKRFTASDHPNGFGDAKSKRILAVVRQHICPTY